MIPYTSDGFIFYRMFRTLTDSECDAAGVRRHTRLTQSVCVKASDRQHRGRVAKLLRKLRRELWAQFKPEHSNVIQLDSYRTH